MLRIHLFSIFTIKTPRALAVLVSLGLLIVKTLTNVLLTITLTVYGYNCQSLHYEENAYKVVSKRLSAD